MKHLCYVQRPLTWHTGIIITVYVSRMLGESLNCRSEGLLAGSGGLRK